MIGVSEGEKNISYATSKLGKAGMQAGVHNSRGCKAGITRETPWQRRKRLQKEKV